MARRSSGGHRQHLEWGLWGASLLALAAGVGGTILTTFGLASTILRIRGQVLVYLDGLGTTGELVKVGLAISKLPEDASSTLLAPITDPAADYLWHNVVHVGYEENVFNEFSQSVSAVCIDIDSKVMRRMRTGDQLSFVAENVTVGAAASVNVAAGGRFLVSE